MITEPGVYYVVEVADVGVSLRSFTVPNGRLDFVHFTITQYHDNVSKKCKRIQVHCPARLAAQSLPADGFGIEWVILPHIESAPSFWLAVSRHSYGS